MAHRYVSDAARKVLATRRIRTRDARDPYADPESATIGLGQEYGLPQNKPSRGGRIGVQFDRPDNIAPRKPLSTNPSENPGPPKIDLYGRLGAAADGRRAARAVADGLALNTARLRGVAIRGGWKPGHG